MKLNEAKVGNSCVVTSAPTSTKLSIFLHSLGIIEGAVITMKSKVGGNYIVYVKDSRYAIDSALAKQIEVKSLEGGIA